ATHLDDLGPIVLARDGGTERGAGNGLGDERGDRLRSVRSDHPRELGRMPVPAALGVRRVLASVLVRGWGVQGATEPGRVRLAERLLPGGVQGADRVPVVAGTASDDGDPPGLAASQVIR